MNQRKRIEKLEEGYQRVAALNEEIGALMAELEPQEVRRILEDLCSYETD